MLQEMMFLFPCKLGKLNIFALYSIKDQSTIWQTIVTGIAIHGCWQISEDT